MTAGGFYLMHRGWMDNPIFDNEPYTTREAWEWLIQRAAWDDAVQTVGLRRVAVQCGQVAVATRYLADAWQWGKGRTDRFLKKLVDSGMIDADARASFTLITIRNYRAYQYREGDADLFASAENESGALAGRERGAKRGADRGADRGAKRGARDDEKAPKNEPCVNELPEMAGDEGGASGAQNGALNGAQNGAQEKQNSTEKRGKEEINKINNTTTRAGARDAGPAGGSPDRAALTDFAAWLERYLDLARPIALDQISLWLGRGATLDLLRQAITTVTDRNREGDSGWRPYSLRYFDGPIERLMRNPPPAVPVDPVVSQWRMRIERYKANGTWLGNWGDPPEQADCLAPRALLIEFGFRQGA